MNKFNVYYRRVLWGMLAISAIILGSVYVIEYYGGYAPCRLCLMQRYAWWFALIIAVVGLCNKANIIMYILMILAAVTLLANGMLALYHSGIEWQLWHNVLSCGADELQNQDINNVKALLFIKNTPSCDEVALTIFGLSLSNYNAIMSTGASILLGKMLYK